MFVVVDSEEIVQVSLEVARSTLCYVDGQVSVLVLDPVHNLPYGERIDLQPRRRRSDK